MFSSFTVIVIVSTCSESNIMAKLSVHSRYLQMVCEVIYQTRVRVSSGYPNTEKRVENTTRSGGFLTNFADETLSRVFDISSQSKVNHQVTVNLINKNVDLAN